MVIGLANYTAELSYQTNGQKSSAAVRGTDACTAWQNAYAAQSIRLIRDV